jgi:nucleoid DNA-binding protein
MSARKVFQAMLCCLMKAMKNGKEVSLVAYGSGQIQERRCGNELSPRVSVA